MQLIGVSDSLGSTPSNSSGSTPDFGLWENALGRRTYAGYGTENRYYDAAGQEIEDRQPSSVTAQYVWGLMYVNQIVVRDDSYNASGDLGTAGSGLGERFYAQQDANWNVTAVVDTSDNVQERMIYSPFGEAYYSFHGDWTYMSNNVFAYPYYWALGFQGAHLDSAGWHFGARDPNNTRWLEPDPAGHAGSGANLYEAMGDNPVRNVHPSGLCADTSFSSSGGDFGPVGHDTSFAAPPGGGGDFGSPLDNAMQQINSHGFPLTSDQQFALQLGVLQNAILDQQNFLTDAIDQETSWLGNPFNQVFSSWSTIGDHQQALNSYVLAANQLNLAQTSVNSAWSTAFGTNPVPFLGPLYSVLYPDDVYNMPSVLGGPGDAATVAANILAAGHGPTMTSTGDELAFAAFGAGKFLGFVDSIATTSITTEIETIAPDVTLYICHFYATNLRRAQTTNLLVFTATIAARLF